MTLSDKLKAIALFQEKRPDAHVGGSIGLFLHGVDLQRSLNKSDIDMTIGSKLEDNLLETLDNLEVSSNPADFDYQFRHFPEGFGGPYTKIDINIQPNKKYCLKEWNGVIYKVSLYADILKYKLDYAFKGVQKHIDDLYVILTGVGTKSTEPKAVEVSASDIDDLPF